MPIVPCFDPATGASGGPSGGGGATTYDVSPPAATTEATAAGVALSAKTFSAFTGTDAGLIDGYTARTVNAAGSTSWSGTGLGAYTPSGGADGDAGVLALDATIGGVVVATALHDYSRASAGPAWSTVEEVDLTDGDVTSGSTSTPGAFTIYAADGVTARVSGVLVVGSGSATVSWDNTGVRIVCSGTAFASFAAPTGSIADVDRDWHVDAIIIPAVSPVSSYMLAFLGQTNNSGNTSIGWDLQNNANKIECRLTTASYAWGLTDSLGGVLPPASAVRMESRGGKALFIDWDKTGAAYLPDGEALNAAYSKAGVIGTAGMWGSGGYFGFGGTTGVDVKISKWRFREYA